MSIQQIVTPDQIEPELLRLWNALAAEKTTRASLFNLLVFNKLSERTDYIRSIVHKIVQRFPCRVLFVTEDPNSTHPYLKTAVSVVSIKNLDNATACDQIDIGATKETLLEVPFLLFPHFLPDLPTYLLWTEDPSKEHPLFEPLLDMAKRVIFDSEVAEDLPSFAKKVLHLHKNRSVEIADLNWARTEGWRELFIATNMTPVRQEELSQTTKISLTYNARQTPFFCHLQIQSFYLISWLFSRLPWSIEKQIPAIEILPTSWEKLGPGTVVQVHLSSPSHTFDAKRNQEHCHEVLLHLCSKETCELPFSFLLGQAATGQSLAKEIIHQGTSPHYLQMLKMLLLLHLK